MTKEQSNTNQIARNTLLLYVRMFLTMVVGLYTSRVVLATLGVEDYGIYTIVGGIVGMLGFLNSSMSGATSRFLTYELGKGNINRLSKTFSSSMIVHVIIALVVFVFAETLGLWYLKNKLVIPENRESAAFIVYQFSVLSSMLSITQVPYNSCIIAHEKMDVYAYVEILNVMLKLAIVYLLLLGNFDKLILYSVLYFLASFVVVMVYRIYCIQKFEECRFRNIWDQDFIRPLLSFSGWNLFGNFGGIVSSQGTNLVINSFFGVAMNAASGIAFTVTGIVNLFASNAMTVFRPAITKKYSQGDIVGMQNLTVYALKFVLFLYSLVAIPVFFECDYLLSLWLVEVPTLSSLFCKAILISIFFETIRYIITINVHASGKVKYISLLSGFSFCLVPFVVYVLYSMKLSVESAFMIIAFTNFLLGLAYVMLAKSIIPQIRVSEYYCTIFKVTVSALISLMLTCCVASLLSHSIINFLTICAFSFVVTCIVFLLVVFTVDQRSHIYLYFKNKISK